MIAPWDFCTGDTGRKAVPRWRPMHHKGTVSVHLAACTIWQPSPPGALLPQRTCGLRPGPSTHGTGRPPTPRALVGLRLPSRVT